MSEPPRPAAPDGRSWPFALALVIVFAASRILYYRMGVRFDAGPIGWFWQYIEIDLLRNELGRSLYYLHSQPPAFNLYLGLVLKAAGHRVRDAFWVTYLLFGLVLHLSMYFLSIRMGARRVLAFLGVCAFAIAPASILYENWLFYAYPITAILCLATLFLHRYLEHERARDGFVFFGLCSVITLTWSLFAAIWFLSSIALVGLAKRNLGWRQVLLVAALPAAIIATVYVKNGLVFGSPSTSSWAGMNIAGMTTIRLDPADRERLIASRRLSSLSRIESFMPFDAYRELVPPVRRWNVPVLDREQKATKIPNYNYVGYIPVSRKYLAESWKVIVARPRLYLDAIGESFLFYALPASDATFLRRNGLRVERFDEYCNAILYGSIGSFIGHRFSFPERTSGPYLWSRASYLWMAIIVLSLAFAARQARRSFGRRRGGSSTTACLVFIAFNTLFVTLLGNAFEISENNRFRFTIDPLIWVTLVVLLSRIRASARSETPPGSGAS